MLTAESCSAKLVIEHTRKNTVEHHLKRKLRLQFELLDCTKIFYTSSFGLVEAEFVGRGVVYYLLDAVSELSKAEGKSGKFYQIIW